MSKEGCDAEAKRGRRRRWTLRILLTALVVFLAAAGWVLPSLGLRWSAIIALRKAGMADVSLRGSDLSFFSGHAAMNSIAAKPQDGSGVSLDDLQVFIHWRALFDRRVAFGSIAVKGLHIAVEHQSKGWVIAGLPLAGSATPPADTGKPWGFGVDSLEATDSHMVVRTEGVDLPIDVDHLTVENLRSWESDVPVHVILQGRLDGAPINVEGTVTPFGAEPSYQMHVTVQAFQPGRVPALLTLASATRLEGRVGADVTIDGHLQGGLPHATMTGQIAVDDLLYEGEGVTLGSGHLLWKGKASIADEIPRLQGRIDLTDAHWEAVGFQGRLRRAAVDADMAVADQGSGILPPLTGKLGLSGDGVLVSQPDQKVEWLSMDRWRIGDLQMSPKEGWRLRDVVAGPLQSLQKNGGAAPGYSWRLAVKELRLDQGALSPQGGVSLGDIRLSSPTVKVQLTRDGMVGLPAGKYGGGPTGKKVPGGKSAKGGGDALPVVVNRLTIGDGLVQFEDSTQAPPVRLRLGHWDLALGRLDLAAPETDSPLSTSGKIGQASLSVNGTVRPMAQAGKIAATVRALELPPLSPYLDSALGINVQTGQFDGDLALALAAGKLNGKLDLTLRNLFIAPPDSQAALARRTQLPIETVLDLLRDDENKIKLAIPISGDLSNPDFDTSDAVAQTVGGALRSTAMTTLSILFPFSALLDSSDGPALALDPVPFDAGHEEVLDGQAAALGKLATLLRERPALKVNLCGVASADKDWAPIVSRARKEHGSLLGHIRSLVGQEEAIPPADVEALRALADARSRNAKAWLSGQGGIDPARLYECRGWVEPAGGQGAGRVEVRL